MSRTRRILGGFSLGYLSFALLTLAGLWLTPFFLHRLGQDTYGLWLLGSQILTYLLMLDFGVVAMLPRETAAITGRCHDESRAAELARALGQTTRMVLWQTPLVAVAALMVWLLVPSAWQPLRPPLAAVLIVFVLLFPLRVLPAVLQGLQDLSFLGIVQICTWTLGTLTTVAMVLAGAGLGALAAGWIVTQLVVSGACGYRLRSRFPEVWPQRLPQLPWRAARQQLTSGLWVSLAQIGVTVLNGTDLFLVGHFLGPAAAVVYSCTGKLTMVLANQPQALMQVAGPALCEIRARESRQRQFEVCTALSQAMLLGSGAVVCLILAVNEGFVGWWVGRDRFGGFGLTALLLLNMLLRHWNTTATYTLFCYDRERRICITLLFDALVTVCLSGLLVPALGPPGAPLGSVLGVCLVSLPANLIGMARQTGVSVLAVLGVLRPFAWRFPLLFGGAALAAHEWMPDTFATLTAAAALAGLAYMAILLPAALRPPVGNYVRPLLARLKGRFVSAPAVGESQA